MPQVFYSRCKPYKYDALDVALYSNRIFFGHAMRKADTVYDRRNLKNCVVDVTCGDDEWANWHARSDKRNQFNGNRNFAKKITPGSIALIPRPSSGVIYCGIVTGDFELVDNPDWYPIWEKIWQSAPLTAPEESWIAIEVAQTWPVDTFRAISLPKIPVWIRRSLFGRSTYGVVQPYGDLNPHSTMTEILKTGVNLERPWTIDLSEVERRLITDVTPNAFEHLVVSLLQLEHRDEIWTHVGGSGDGGLDGIGANASGEVVGLLQCKWSYDGEQIFMNPSVTAGSKRPVLYLASAFHSDCQSGPDGFEFLSKSCIAQMLVRHASNLPQAIALRVG